jgi:hypothetical protein
MRKVYGYAYIGSLFIIEDLGQVVKYDTKYGSGSMHQCVSLQQRFYTFKRNVGLVIETSMYHCMVELVFMQLKLL